ncbi:MAG: hypothetical protein GEU28_13280 [Dehalococcoidia bacterium]|nr:hypothetical protein [Dehalococcoidia bacterium]
MPVGIMDRELRELAASGDSEAFSELIRRQLPGLFDFTARLLRDTDAARDLLTGVVAGLAHNAEALNGRQSLRAVAFAVTLEKATDRLRSHGGLSADPIILNAPVSDTFCRSSLQPAGGDDLGSGMAILTWQVVSSLDRRQYALLDLWLRQRLDTSEIAHVLGLSTSAVESAIARMERSVESAVLAVVIAERGRRWCRDLDITLADSDRMRITEETRRRLGDHIETCSACTQTGTRFGSGIELYRSLQPVSPPPGLRSALLAPALPILAERRTRHGERSEGPRLRGNRVPIISPTGRFEPIIRGVAVDGPAVPPVEIPIARQAPRFQAARVPLQGVETSNGGQAYTYSYDPEHTGHHESRTLFYSLLGSLAIVGLLGLAGLLFVLRGDGGSSQPEAVVADTAAAQEPGEPPLTVSASDLDFGVNQTERVVTLSTNVGDTLTWTLETDDPWIGANPDGGSIASGETVAIAVSVSRDLLGEGLHSGRLNLVSSGGEESEIFVELVVPGSGPTISDERLNIPQDEETGALHIFRAGCEPQPTAFRVSAAIADPSGITSAFLVYTVGSDEEERAEMDINGDRWEGAIPPLTRDGPIVYHIEATDDAGNITTSNAVTVELRGCPAGETAG